MKTALAPTRSRLIEAAKTLFQERGYHGVGVSDILAAAQAPKGSLYHAFPGGKDEIAAAAAARIAADVSALIAMRRAAGVGAGDILIEIGAASGEWLKRSKFAQGPLIAVMAQSAGAETPLLREAVRRAYGDWRDGLAGALTEAGWDAREAMKLAVLGFAALEGGLAQARVERNLGLVDDCLTQAAALMRRPAGEADRARPR